MALSCAPTGGGEDAGPEVDRFADYGEPMDSPEEEWSWVDFDEAVCGDGSSTGILINRSATADAPIMLYMVGGGLCFDQASCFGSGFIPATVSRLSFNSADAQTLQNTEAAEGVFRRDDVDNPFRDFHHVVIPYCTGDIHGGSNIETSYGVQHAGYLNMSAFLQRIVPSFPDSPSVVLTGSSAGGFGALINYAQALDDFIDLPVSLLLDSSPPFSNALIPEGFDQTTREAWDLDGAIPDGCESCDSFYTTFTYLLDTHPDLRVGLISSLQDQTLRYLIGYGGSGDPNAISGPQYQQELIALVNDVFAFRDNTRVYLVPGDSHVFLVPGAGRGLGPGASLGDLVVQGTSMSDWLRGFLGEGSWNQILPQ
jgi:hypothetical protein